jgi:uncharacterized protein
LGDLVDGPDQRKFGQYKREGLPSWCQPCPDRKFCNGDCLKNGYLETPAGEPGLNYLCPGYRRFFTYVQPYLDIVERTVDDGVPLRAVIRRICVHDYRRA